MGAEREREREREYCNPRAAINPLRTQREQCFGKSAYNPVSKVLNSARKTFEKLLRGRNAMLRRGESAEQHRASFA